MTVWKNNSHLVHWTLTLVMEHALVPLKIHVCTQQQVNNKGLFDLLFTAPIHQCSISEDSTLLASKNPVHSKHSEKEGRLGPVVCSLRNSDTNEAARLILLTFHTQKTNCSMSDRCLTDGTY